MFCYLIIVSSEFLIRMVFGDLLIITSAPPIAVFIIIESLKYLVFLTLLILGLSKLVDIIDKNNDNFRPIVLRVFWIFISIQLLQFIYPLVKAPITLANIEAFENYSMYLTGNALTQIISSTLEFSKYVVLLIFTLHKLR